MLQNSKNTQNTLESAKIVSIQMYLLVTVLEGIITITDYHVFKAVEGKAVENDPRIGPKGCVSISPPKRDKDREKEKDREGETRKRRTRTERRRKCRAKHPIITQKKTGCLLESAGLGRTSRKDAKTTGSALFLYYVCTKLLFGALCKEDIFWCVREKTVRTSLVNS